MPWYEGVGAGVGPPGVRQSGQPSHRGRGGQQGVTLTLRQKKVIENLTHISFKITLFVTKFHVNFE